MERSAAELLVRPATRTRRLDAPLACLTTVAGLVALQVIAANNAYALRVIGDTPTFLALVQDMAVRPLKPQSPFFGTADIESIHASPYLQVIALIWKRVAPAGRLDDALALGHFLGLVAIAVMLFVLGMLWLYVRDVAGRTAAHWSIPVLLAVFGPIHLAFASDLSVNGFLYAGFYPTTFATGLTLATLVLLRRTSLAWSVAAVPVVAATITTDALNGAVLVVIVILYTCRIAEKLPREGIRIPLILTAGFLLAGTWPAYPVFHAFAANGLPVPLVLALAFAAPPGWLWLRSRVRAPRRRGALLDSPRAEVALAVVGVVAVAGLAALAVVGMIVYPSDQPLLQSNRLGFYWNDDRWRWLLLVGPGALGVIGLARLARRGRWELAIWFLGMYAFAVLGSIAEARGLKLPLHYRFTLLCQVPLAIGLAHVLAHHRSRLAATLTGAALAAALLFATVTLVGVSDRLTYFGAPLQPAWSLAGAIAPDTGAVATDPSTSYYIPSVTGNRVLTLGSGHAEPGAERDRADAGYAEMRDLYLGTPAVAAKTLRAMYARGVRWVVVEKFITFTPKDLEAYSATPYGNIVRRPDAPLAARYTARLLTAGDLAADDVEYSVIKLHAGRVHRATRPARRIPRATARRIRLVLARLGSAVPASSAVIARELRGLGVKTVTMIPGWIGSRPKIFASGPSIANGEVGVLLPRTAAGAGCAGVCTRAAYTVLRLGVVLLDDRRFKIVRLP